MRTQLLVLVGLMMTQWNVATAAVGCSLRDPDADIRGFFPTMTDYSVHLVTFENQNPLGQKTLREKLGTTLDPVYEQADTPYSLYIVNQDNKRLGYVFGTNQRGKYSNIQVIAVVDAMLNLQRVYLQKIRSPFFEIFQSDEFGTEMATIPLSSYPSHQSCFRDADCEKFPVKDPTQGSESDDFRAIIRALAKLSILSDTLLRPGQSPVPPSSRAMAEWIGNAGGIEPSRAIVRTPRFIPLNQSNLQLDEPVVLWQTTSGARIFRLSDLQTTPLVTFKQDDKPHLLVWSDSSHTATIHPTERDLRMTSDILFGVRLLYEPDSGSRVSPILGTTVYGGTPISIELRPGVGVVSANTATRLAPSATVLESPNASATPTQKAKPVGPLVLVRQSDDFVEAWRATALVDESDVISTEYVQFWMTLEGFLSTFPHATLHADPIPK